jgi:glutathione S-transferase
MKFYCAWFCPFAQRTWIALLYKGVDFEYVEIDPYDKTDEWIALSRGKGQVPVLVDTTDDGKQISIPESFRTLEYIEMKYAGVGPALYPASALESADVKFWLDYQGGRIVPYFYRFLKAKKGSDIADEERRNYEHGLETYTKQMQADGPFFLGRQPGVIDFALAPFILRTEIVLQHYKGYTLPMSGPVWARFHKWWDAMRDFEPLIASSTGVKDFAPRVIDFYLDYSQGDGQTDVTLVS